MKRIWLIFTLFAVLAGNLSAGQTEASVFLWKDGKSGYRIILPSKYENQGIRLYLLAMCAPLGFLLSVVYALWSGRRSR